MPEHNIANSAAPRIPGYTVTSTLGSGGFATVYLAQQLTLQREVALKVLDPSLVGDANFCERFLREARDTASVSEHPNIITIHDVGQADNIYYIAMQHLPGTTLKQKIQNAETPSNPSRILYQLASALHHVHQRGFIHRDIKPDNVLFNEKGDVVLSDFGVARMNDRAASVARCDTIVGTAKYMSPEQSRGDPHTDARSDLYGLGVVLFELLTGHPPYEATNPATLRQQHALDPTPSLPASHADFQPILNKLLAKRPDQRYPSADLLMRDLITLHGPNVAGAESKYTAPASSPKTNTLLNETHSSTVIAVTLTFVTLISASMIFLYSQSEPGIPSMALRCPALSQSEKQHRDQLLEIASAHESIGRLTHPPGANAHDALLMALEIDSCNQSILDSVKRLERQQ